MSKAKDWLRKRKHQGYSYAEVVAEIERRVAGNYIFSKAENEKRLFDALERVDLLFCLSATLHDFLEEHRMTLGQLFEQLDDLDMNDGIERALNPFPKGSKEDKDEIKTCGIIDMFYPGKDLDIERDAYSELLVSRRKNK